jgi:hypothetical protein
MFARKVRAYPNRASPSLDKLLTLPMNIRLGWKDLPGTYTLDIMDVKSLIMMGIKPM